MNWLTNLMLASVATQNHVVLLMKIFSLFKYLLECQQKTLSHINWEECYCLYLEMLEIKYIVSVFQLKDKKGLDSYYFSNTLSI